MPKPTKQDVLNLAAQFTREADEDFFFNSLKSPDWIAPLVEAGYFKQPPQPIANGETLRFPAWSQTRYLARVAALAPEQVVKVTKAIPETDNPQILHDLFDIALALPPEFARKLLPELTRVTKYRTNHEGLRNYAEHLAVGGFVGESLRVVECEIGFQPDPEASEKTERYRQQEYGVKLEPVTPAGEWEFDQIAKEVVPKIVEAQPVTAIRVLCKELDNGVRLSCWEPEKADGNETSIYWRPSVTTHGQNRFPNTLSRYVSMIRDACEAAIRKQPDTFTEIDSILAKFPWTIFERLRIHLVTEFPELAGPARLHEIALTKEFFEEPWWKREYTRFMQSQFSALAPEAQATVLSWVDAGPTEEEEAFWREQTGDDVDHLMARRASWHIQHVQAFKEALPEDWKVRYQDWQQAGGVEDQHLGFAFWIGDVKNLSGSELSPLTTEKIAEMGIDDTVDYLKSWTPPGTFMGPDRSNLSSTLEQHIKKEPSLYAEAADRFADLPHEYVSVIIRALAEAFVAKTIHNTEPSLRLLEKLVQTHGRKPADPDQDDGWDYARLEAARFFEKVLPLNPPVFAPEQRARIWGVLSVLATDPNPSAENEKLHTKSGFDAYTSSLNRTRGTALHAVFDYAVWTKGTIPNDSAFSVPTALPEVASLLHDRLNPLIEPTLMARTVFGQSFPILFNLDRAYAESLRPKIFPIGDMERYWTAWNTYVTAWRVGRDMLKVLPTEYEQAVERLSDAKSKRGTHWDPHQALGNQLLRLYWQGVLPWDDSLFQRFLTVAPTEVIANILEEMGRLLKNTEGAVDEKVLGRLRHLWESRANMWKQDIKRRDSEAAAFCWWFSSDKFDRTWATKEMLAALDRTGTTSMDYMVLEQFAEQVNETPIQAIQAVLKMAMSAQETGRFFYADKRARKILYMAGQSSMPGIRMEAEIVRDQLLALKYESFRDALDRPPSE